MMKYIGQGAYIHGVPAKDLSDEQEKAFGKLIAEQEKLTGLKLYESVKEAAKDNAGKGNK